MFIPIEQKYQIDNHKVDLGILTVIYDQIFFYLLFFSYAFTIKMAPKAIIITCFYN